MKENNIQISGIFVIIVLISSILIGTSVLIPLGSSSHTYELKTFSSYDELFEYLNEKITNGSYQYVDRMPLIGLAESMDSGAPSKNGGGTTVDYSETNIQVEGVDEPDIVKTDGTYLYVLANNVLYILRGYPADDAVILSKIIFAENESITNFFVNDDRLIVFGNTYEYPQYKGELDYYWWGGATSAVIQLFDITDKENPHQLKKITIDGHYLDARMIGDFVYVVASEYAYDLIWTTRAEGINKTPTIPEISVDDVSQPIPIDQIYYVDTPQPAESMTHILAIDVNDGELTQKSFLIGNSEYLYVSQDNIYLASTQYDYVRPLVGELIVDDVQFTILHRIAIDSEDISYISQGEVPGHILNQFSMDEHDGYLRIATTTGWGDASSNHLFVLDSELTIEGKIEDLAPGEQIYSTRFLGNRAYMVTFRQIDPLYVIDLTHPTNPKVLGYLKVTGFSNYLHPYDETHIIGVGKEATEEGRVLGVKISLFDVSDVTNPIEMGKYEIKEGEWSHSQALYDHKAFLFDKEKQLLVMPVSYSDYDEYWQGAHVFTINLDEGIKLRGKITHEQDDAREYWEYQSYSYVSRSLYIEDVLYTISNDMIKMNDLSTLSEINSVQLN